MGLDLTCPVGVPSITVGEEGGAVGAEARRDAGGGHASNEREGHGWVAVRGGEAGDAGEGGLVGLDVVGLHPGEDVEASLGGLGGGGGGGGAEVEEAVVVVEVEPDLGGGGERGVVEAEGGGEIGVAGAHVELVLEEALGGVAGAAPADGLASASATSRRWQCWRRRGGCGRGRGGVAAWAGEGKVLDGEAAVRVRVVRVRVRVRRAEEEGDRGAEGPRRRRETHPRVCACGCGCCWEFLSPYWIHYPTQSLRIYSEFEVKSLPIRTSPKETSDGETRGKKEATTGTEARRREGKRAGARERAEGGEETVAAQKGIRE